MILEHVVIDVIPERADEFDAAVAHARSFPAGSPGFVSLRLHRCVEQPDRFLLLVEWETLEDHTERFRGSDAFGQWRAIVGPFFASPPTVQHYELTSQV